MCGISGIIHQNNTSVAYEKIKPINDLIAHRGPDDEGFYFGTNFALGHRRLAILDLSSEGHQPMHYMDRYVITYNGEVYNYLEIKEILTQEGYTFHSFTDTEVILAAYDKWGRLCVNYFNGMWAFAIYDKVSETLFCSRDRFGVKPFYYAVIDGQFVFGSEIKQITYFQKKRYVNKEILIDFIVTSIQEHTNQTFFKDIFTLEPAHTLWYDLRTHRYKIERYYFICTSGLSHNVSLDKAILNYEDELKRAVYFRLRSDVLVGTCLSGGLDSSSVATFASMYYREKSPNRFIAIHAKSSEKSSDESTYARYVAEASSLDLRVIEPSTEEFKELLDEVVYTQEEPFGSPSIFMQYCVMKKAKEIGCKVMLDGQGGDETLLGYEKYYPSVYVALFKTKGILAVLKAMHDSQKHNTKMSFKWIAKYTLGILLPSLRKYLACKNTKFLKAHSNSFLFLDKLSRSYWDIKDLQTYEIEHTNLPVLLRYEDKNSMRHSIETRLPFLDYQTLEAAIKTNIHYKIYHGWTKYILRRILHKYLPHCVVWRKDKLGFNAPESIWMVDISEKIEQEIKRSKILNQLCNINALIEELPSMEYRLKWRLYNIAVWERVYGVHLD